MSISQNFPSTRPSLNLNFARSQKLDPRITFTRSSSATYTGGDGLIKTAATDTPRFDFNATTGECLGLLIEESRTNLLTYSEQFDNASWTKTNIGITTNTTATTAPDGTNTAEKLAGTNGATTRQSVYQNYSFTAGTKYTVSIFAKQAERRYFSFWFDSPNISEGAYYGAGSIVDLQTGTLTAGSTQTITISSVGNGWYRCSVSATPTVSGSFALSFAIGEPNNSPPYNATGDGTSGIYLWGAQLEAGAFATSYIPTVASTVTRSADNASITGTNFSSFYNPSEGSVLGVYDRISTGFITNVYPAIAYFGAWPTRIALMDFGGAGSTGQQFDVVISGTWQAQFYTDSVATPANTNRSVIGAYKQDNFAAVGNGKNLQTDTSGNIPTVSSFAIGWDFAGTNYLNGHISQLLYYPVRLSNSQLQSLTK
jgi:hypothetical protein